MMNRRDFMKLSAASAVTVGAVAGMAPASFAENAGVHTDAEVQAMVAEELRLSREVAFYPAAFRGDFAARKLPLTFIVAITAGGSVDFALFLHGVANHSGHNTNRFHNVLLLDSLGRPSEVPPTR